eukprot:g14903.t1
MGDTTVPGFPPEPAEPSVLLCPITQVMFRDPVFIPESGNTYERSAIETYWSGRPKCPRDPLTNVSLSGTLYTNWGLRREVQSFLDEHPSYVPQGWEDRSVPVPAQLPSSSNQPRRWKRRSTGEWLRTMGGCEGAESTE